MMKVIAVILDRYKIYEDGVIYDSAEAEDIPQFVFEIRNILLNNLNK